jgi:hypothetical protein
MAIPYLTIGKWVGGIVGGLVVAWIFYAGLIRPTTKPPITSATSSQQEAQNITNYEYTYSYTPRISFGCACWRLAREIPTNTTISTP